MNLHTAFCLQPDRFEVISFVGAGGKSTAMFRLADEIVARGGRVVTATTTRIAAEQIHAAPAFLPVTGTRLPMDEIGAALDRHSHCLLIGRDSAERGPGDKKAGVDPHHIDELASHHAALNLSAILVEADGSRMLPAKAPAAHEPAMPASSTLVVSLVGLDAVGLPIADPYLHRPERIRTLLALPQVGECRLTPAHVVCMQMHEAGGRKGVPPNARFLTLLNKTDTPPRLASARLIAHGLAQVGRPALIGAVGRRASQPILERWGAIALVVLAAGGSSRMGGPKQLVAVDGEAMVVRAARCALQSGAADIVLVTGASADPVTRALARLGDRPMDHLRIVHNRNWQEGQASSIRAAVEVLPAQIEAVIFMPADQPFTPVRLLRRLQQRWREGADLVAPLVDGRTRGAPALFGRPYWPALLTLHGDVGARGILRRHASDVFPVPADAETLRDLDLPEHLTR